MFNHKKTNRIVYLYVIIFVITLYYPINALANFFVIPVGSKSLNPSDIVQLRLNSVSNLGRVHQNGTFMSREYTVPLGKVFIITAITHIASPDSSPSSPSPYAEADLYQIRVLPDPPNDNGQFRMKLQTAAGVTNHYIYPSGIVIAPGYQLYMKNITFAVATMDVQIFGYEVTSK